MNIVVYPNAKVNIGLRIIGKREDGFHNLETLFVPIKSKDILEIVESKSLSMNYYGIPYTLPDNSLEKELCIKAYRLLQKDFGIPEVGIYLHKNIPIGAGLGGGSSDAAFTLKALNSLFKLGLTEDRLVQYASRLGSDCPFFIYNRPMFGEGRGNILTPFEADWLSSLFGANPIYAIKVVTPSVSISTAEAYSGVIPDPSGKGLRSILTNTPIIQWRGKVINDFEYSIFANHPEIAQAKEQLYSQGAVYAAMSGSGSAVFGLFHRENQ